MSTKSEFLKHFPDFTWDLTPEVIENRSLNLIDDINKRIYDMTCLSEDKINFQSVCESLADIEAKMERERSIIDIYYFASPIGQVQDACLKLRKMWSDFFIEISMRRDVYDLLIKVQSFEKSLPYESARYLDKLLLNKRRDGLHLEADVREKLTALIKKMSNLCIDFNKNISDVDTTIEFEKMDLLGMPEDFFMGLKEKDDKYTVTLTHSHIIPILRLCSITKTRQIVEKAYNSRCMDKNVKILEELLELRDERAKILGYKTHADFVTEILMSKSADKVHEFLKIMFNKIKFASNRERRKLLELKKKECKEIWVDFDNTIHPYDFLYYENMVEKNDYKIDKNIIKEYFPFEHVTTQLLDIYQKVLGLKFEQVVDPPVIHSDVLLYAVYEKATNLLMGYFYMDLFPRHLKYSNPTCISIQAACHYNNMAHIGCAVMMANFSKPLPEKPSLLTHEELRTYFHEFGHVMHQICSKTRYKIFHGTSVERDFVESPSQMFENWCWEKISLKKISSHYIIHQPLSDGLIKNIINSRKANISMYYARQICLSMFDHIIHTTQKVFNVNNLANIFEVLKECIIEYSGMEPTPGTNFAASFEHMCTGYDARYYGYLWSQVLSYDMFSKFKKEGVLSSKPGINFRNMLLRPGSTKDASEMFKEFIGRDPIIDPFMENVATKTYF